jgi:RIO kinase 2
MSFLLADLTSLLGVHQYMAAVANQDGGSEEEEFSEEEEEEEAGSGNDSNAPVGSSRPTSPSEGDEPSLPVDLLKDQMAITSISEPAPAPAPSPSELPASSLVTNAPTIEEDKAASDSSFENPQEELKTRVAAEMGKNRSRQQKKHHSKKSTTSAGRAKGSKAKQDTKVHIDGGGWW